MVIGGANHEWYVKDWWKKDGFGRYIMSSYSHSKTFDTLPNLSGSQFL